MCWQFGVKCNSKIMKPVTRFDTWLKIESAFPEEPCKYDFGNAFFSLKEARHGNNVYRDALNGKLKVNWQ